MRKSLLEDRPDLLSEWSEKNLPLTPADVSAHSERPVWWKCDQGHEWIAPIQNRNGKNRTGCPYCGSERVITGKNDLKTNYPEIAAEWSDRNLPRTPDRMAVYSNQKVWWRCPKGHEWRSMIKERTIQKKNCVICETLRKETEDAEKENQDNER